jgi:unsaturated rhamnogalacturonyl hydrolase
MLFNILFISVLLVVFVIVLIDQYSQFYTWQSRIKIGRFMDKKIWIKSIDKKALQWLKKTPTIKLTDSNRLIIIDILKGNYKRSAIQSWQEAALVLGLSTQYERTKDERLKKAIDIYIGSKITSNGSWKTPIKESDEVILGYALIQISWLSHEQYKPAYDALYQLIVQLKGNTSTVSYKKHTQNYRFVDTIGFICPFLIAYGQKFNVPEAVDLAIIQIEEFNTYGMLNDMFIPCHTYTMNTKLPTGLFGWGRGLGWYAIGLIDSWNLLAAAHPKKLEMTQWVEKFAKMAMQFQRSNGSWGWIIMQDSSRSDSSTTATLAWFLTNAANIVAIQSDCDMAKEKAIHYLMKVTRRDGAIDFSQGDTKAIGVHSQEFDILPFTQGFALRSACV